MLSISSSPKFCCLVKRKSFPKQQILDFSKLKELRDDNFKLMKMAENSLKG